MYNKILIYNSGGGLGDSIQLFPLLSGLQSHFDKAEFYYLSSHSNHFEGKLKEFGLKIQSLELGVKYFGFRWWHYFIVKKKFLESNIEKFDLIIDLQSKIRNTIILKKIPHNNFYSSTFNYFFCSHKNLESLLKDGVKIKEYDIKKISKIYYDEAKRLLPDKNYIGFSITQGNAYRKKGWPLEKFLELANQIKKGNKKIVFFIEKKENEIIQKIKKILPEAVFPELNSAIACPALVTALSSRLEKGITIDNGIMHMMALANIPLIVLFGPTNSKKFAPKIKNIKIIDSKELYNSKDINKISIETVMKSFNS